MSDKILEGVDESLTLNEIFRLEPQKLTPEHRKKIITSLCEARTTFFTEQALSQKRGGRTPRKASLSPEKTKELLDTITLDNVEF